MTTHDSPAGPSPDATETLVQERFESSVAGLQLDVPALVNGGLGAGQRLRRRRRWQQGAGAVAGVAMIASLGVIGSQTGLFDRSAAPHVTHQITQLVPSTPRALAAAVLRHLPGSAQVLGVGGQFADRGSLQAEVGFTLESARVDLLVTALAPGDVGDASCKSKPRLIDCQDVSLPDGTRILSGRQRDSSLDGARASVEVVLVVGQNQAVAVIETVIGGTTGGQQSPMSAGDLQEIALDPLIGFETSQRMIDEGASITGFRSSLVQSGSGSRTSRPNAPADPPYVTNPGSSAKTASVPPGSGPSTKSGSGDPSKGP